MTSPVGDFEEFLTALLIRHAVNGPGYEYDPRRDQSEHADPDDSPPF